MRNACSDISLHTIKHSKCAMIAKGTSTNYSFKSPLLAN